ncbi:MAG TPA: TAXI family TRAP transporter solute-binding subunit [Candidatus Binataceae bacterium]|nr:TAXI family TRAP transporter solute-binding subunit [Candidatus Binataceae bacterium]
MNVTMPLGPSLKRSVTLHFMGDWGQANLHRVCGWLAQEVGERSGPYSRFATWNGRGGVDSVKAVGRGTVDLALTTPAAFARMALDGRGPYAAEPFPFIRALGTIPQRDRLVLAIDAAKNIRSFDDLRERRPALRIAISTNDGINNIGLAGHKLLELEGITRERLESWGGRFVEAERPDACLEFMKRGEADAVFQEAIMTPWWRDLTERVDLTFVPVERSVLDQVERDYGWPRAVLPAGYFRNLNEPLETLDFSDFLIIVRADMPDDIAELLAYCIAETSEALEVQYRHLAPERSPVTYPLVPTEMARTAIPLHPAAARYYASQGYIAKTQ